MRVYDKKIVAERIKYLRIQANISQEQLAEKLGMKRTNMSNYEAGRVIPPSNILFALAETFNVSTDFILGRESHNLISPIESENKALKKAISDINKIVEELAGSK